MTDTDAIQDEERDKKRSYLHAEIIDAGYDSEQFVLFAGKGEEVDIDTWSYDELKSLVAEFK